eukprot:CAMPEP_0185754454 /NCGR_PEP_ID=MMETSP1174-20130828/13101_1 /TAXON_ID=35687 /ORGANISM="Dictyocha speculum, Strain CCMP1381" /LENGTH=174 /DNA_ID=CAMNT_0028432665 /DNA_START=191 /DNA_END=715 /DNA_ORIENTATION=+
MDGPYHCGFTLENLKDLIIDDDVVNKLATVLSPGQPSSGKRVINSLSLLAGVCFICGMNEDAMLADIVHRIFMVFDFRLCGRLTFDEVTIALTSTLRALESISGHSVDSVGGFHITETTAERMTAVVFNGRDARKGCSATELLQWMINRFELPEDFTLHGVDVGEVLSKFRALL